MESKTLKKIIEAVVVFSFLHFNAFAQLDSLHVKKHDRFRILPDVTFSSTVFRVMGPHDVGSGNVTVIGSHEVVKEPRYRNSSARMFTFNTLVHITMNIPVHRNRNWSAGLRSTLGFGYQRVFVQDELSSFIFNGGQYVYFREYSKLKDVTFFAGMRYTLGPVSHGLFLIGADFNRDKRKCLRVYLSPFRRTYYYYLSNDTYKPALRVMELGISATI